MRSGTDLCRGQRTLDSKPSKSDSLVCLFTDIFWRVAEEILYFFLNFEALVRFQFEQALLWDIPGDSKRGICPSVLFLAAIGSFSMSNY